MKRVVRHGGGPIETTQSLVDDASQRSDVQSLSLEKMLPVPDEIEARIQNNHALWTQRFGTQTSSSPSLVIAISEPRLIKEHEATLRAFPRGTEALLRELGNGNTNPGIGTKHLFGTVSEARHRDGARVYFRTTADGVEVVASSTKASQRAVIALLRSLYGS